MNRKRLLAVLAIATAILLVRAIPAAAQVVSTPPQPVGCVEAIIDQTDGQTDNAVHTEFSNPLEMAHEGLTERSADFTIYSASKGQTCFKDGTTIHVRFPAILTNAAGTNYGVDRAAAIPVLAGGVVLPYAFGGAGTSGAYYLVDPSSTMSVTVTASLVAAAGAPGGLGTDFKISISTGTSAPGGTAPILGTSSEAYIVFQNLRWDVTPFNNGLAKSPGGAPFIIVTSADGVDLHELNTAGQLCDAGTDGCYDVSLFDPTLQIGTVRNEIYCTGPFTLDLDDGGSWKSSGQNWESDSNCADVFRVGFGLEDGVNPFVFTSAGEEGATVGGPGNKTGLLIRQAIFYITENPYWQFVNPFRIALNPPKRVKGDITTGPTDLILDFGNIPYNVTLTVPPSLTICSGGAPAVVWQLKSGGPSLTGPANGGGELIVVYKTVLGDVDAPGLGTLVVFTAANAADANCTTQPFPTIGVFIADPSGIGNITLRVVKGPTEAADPLFAADPDVNAGAIPRYMQAITPSEGNPSGGPSRGIIETSGGQGVFYIDIDPTRTYLLYSYVTENQGWETAVEVANTGLDCIPGPGCTIAGANGVFAPEGVLNSGQAGKLDIWVFPNGSTPFVYTATAADGRGLDVNGLLQPGNIWADTLNSLLTNSGHAALVNHFDGYIIIVCHFNFGHGAAYIFNGNVQSGTSVPALVLGGASARLGDVTKLPERLDQ